MKFTKQLNDKYYDRFNRDPESIKFYQSPMWRKTRQMKLSRDPLCEACLQEGVTTNKIELEILKDAASS